MPSDDEFSDSDDEMFDYRQPYYGYDDSEGQSSVQDIDTDIEDLTNALSRLTVSSLSSSSSSSLSSSSSSSLNSNIPLDSLLDQLALVTRQAADLLTSQYSVPIPENLNDRIFDLHPRDTTSQYPWLDESSGSEQPISVWINAMPQGRGSQRVCPIVAFLIIILMLLSHSQFPFPQ